MKVIGGRYAFLRPGNHGRLDQRCALPKVCRLVRQEFLAVLYTSVDILTRVSNFNFAHIVTFFNRLQDSELNTLPLSVSRSDRRMLVSLEFPLNRGGVRTFHARLEAHLNRWLNRLEHPTKKGVNVNVTYRCIDFRRAHFGITLLNQKLEASKGDKRLNEMGKMIEALER